METSSIYKIECTKNNKKYYIGLSNTKKKLVNIEVIQNEEEKQSQ